MRRVSLARFYLVVMALMLALASPAWSASVPVANLVASELPVLDENASIEQLSDRLDQIRQGVTSNANDDLLSQLRMATVQVQRQADALSTLRAADAQKLDDKLKVIGPVQKDEAATLALQRKELEAQKKSVLAEQDQATKLTQSARDLSTQIVNLRRSQFNSQVTSRAASPLSPAFWQSLIRPTEDDVMRLRDLRGEAADAVASAFSAEHRGFFITSLVAAILVWTLVRLVLERLLAAAMIRWLPEGRLRRSALALSVSLATLGTIAGAVSLLRWGLQSSAMLGSDIASLTNHFLMLVVFSAFITGLGRAMLMLQRPSWRLPPIPDEVASALGWFPKLLALALMVMLTFERINSVIGTSLALTVATNGLTALVVAAIFSTALIRYRRTLRKHELARPTGLAGLIPFVIVVWVGLILLTLLAGYLTLAYFLTAKLLWISMVATCAYLLTTFLADLCETLLSPRQPGGLALASSLGLAPRHQAQASTILTGVSRTILLFLAVMLALMPSGTSPGELLMSLGDWDGTGGKLLGNLNIVPQDILLAVAMLLGGMLGIRVLKRWLSERLLPETDMDAGMRASLVTLVGYLGFLFLAMLVMSTLRINLTSLTWVVSALSVGIGFGLQQIVQNFISGLILLTERPVKVGDWVSLAGVEGDIRRINVRATEIQMSDRSTVIVPNSQFISQNVRNVTMGNALGVVGITLTLPLETDANQVRDLLLTAFHEHEAILDAPAASVTFKDLTTSGMVISVSGYVAGPRQVSGARSDLLFTILGRLRDEGIPLSSPQSMVLVQEGARPADEPA
ncbi:mechanosensitive ion channel protein MscS [Pseudomonas putida]|nr:mechanosensitive ion channel protein MscS [Pseudomonas putida]HEK1692348.1 mechanosensitive ion channel family protein [Pseudomonas putida]